MADPKKPVDDKAADPPEQASYHTPELDPATGAPLDTRFQNDTSKEATASKPSPKSETETKPAQAPPLEYDEGGSEEGDTRAPKGKEKPRSRR